MAQKKKRHGKVEYRKSRPLLRFRLAVPIVIIIATFVFFFVMYMVSAVTRKDYWEQEILSTMRGSDEDKNARKAVKVTNPVPSSARADASRMGECAFVGDVSVLGNYYELTSGLVFTDAVTDMSESRMRSIGRSIRSASPKAIYLWYQCPSDLEKGAASYESLVDNLIDQNENTPVYVLTALPASDAADNQKVDTWNAALFAMSDKLGLHYVDISTTLKSNDGLLNTAYSDEKTLYQTIGDLILTHIAD